MDGGDERVMALASQPLGRFLICYNETDTRSEIRLELLSNLVYAHQAAFLSD